MGHSGGLPGLGLTASKSAYHTDQGIHTAPHPPVFNLLYCKTADSTRFALIARSKSGDTFQYADGLVGAYRGTIIQGTGSLCSGAGITAPGIDTGPNRAWLYSQGSWQSWVRLRSDSRYNQCMSMHRVKQFSVDSHGAYVTELVDAAGRPILYPRTTIGGKRRGGAHVCMPYFGADAAGVLPQHGFGRDVEWELDAQGDGTVHYLHREMNDEEWTGSSAVLTYTYDAANSSFMTSLTMGNRFTRLEQLTFSPGFHPYFAVDPRDVRLNGERIDLADFEPYKEFPNTPSMTIESNGRAITVSSQELQHMVVWTDRAGDYLCVEPTLSGHSFDSSRVDGEATRVKTYSYSISWTE